MEFPRVHTVKDDVNALFLDTHALFPARVVGADGRNLVGMVEAKLYDRLAEAIHEPAHEERFHLAAQVQILLTEIDAVLGQKIRRAVLELREHTGDATK